MRIAIGADHGGYRLKEFLVKYLQKKGHNVKDFGTYSNESCDYPLISYKVAKAVGSKRFFRGILICKTGIGMCIVANKVKGVRAALCNRIDIARLSREHNNANVLVMAANMISTSKAKELVDMWLKTRALPGRHRRRVGQINRIDELLEER